MKGSQAKMEGGEVARTLVLTVGEDSVEVLEISDEAGSGKTLGDVIHTEVEGRDRPGGGHDVGQEGDREQD